MTKRATYRSATGNQLGLELVLCRDDARRRAGGAKAASETYAGWQSECKRLVAEAQTPEQKRIAKGYAHVAELRTRFESDVARLYDMLARGGEVPP